MKSMILSFNKTSPFRKLSNHLTTRFQSALLCRSLRRKLNEFFSEKVFKKSRKINRFYRTLLFLLRILSSSNYFSGLSCFLPHLTQWDWKLQANPVALLHRNLLKSVELHFHPNARNFSALTSSNNDRVLKCYYHHWLAIRHWLVERYS